VTEDPVGSSECCSRCPARIPAAPLNDLLRIGLGAAPDEVAVVSVHRALSWRELDRASAALAGGYRKLGLEPGDRLASVMPNRVDVRGRRRAVEHPAVSLAGAVGIHDEVHGENVRAYVTLRNGVEPPSRADLIVFCRERIGYKAPDEIVFLERMPLDPRPARSTGSGSSGWPRTPQPARSELTARPPSGRAGHALLSEPVRMSCEAGRERAKAEMIPAGLPGVHFAELRSDLMSATGPRCVSLSGLMIALMVVI
jgi:AMP-binding enzyme C-terminal domain